MGLFDVFSRGAKAARRATFDELLNQVTAERERIGNALAALETRQLSVASWLEQNREVLVRDYSTLLEAFLTRDPRTVADTITAMGDRITVVAAIPVHYEESLTITSFQEMAQAVFPDYDSLAVFLRPS
jgi:hypothetical protein